MPVNCGRRLVCFKSRMAGKVVYPSLVPMLKMAKDYFLILLVVFVPCLVDAQPTLDKVNASYVSTAGTFAVTWIAKEAKLFQKYGLDLQLIKIPGSPRLVQAVLGGDVQFGHTGGTSAVNAIVRGAELAVLAQTGRGFSSHLMVKPGIASLTDLRGRKIGVPQYGSTADLFLREGLKKWKFEPDRDVTVIQVGGMTEAFAALTGGALDGAVIPTELAFRAKKMGFQNLFSFKNLDLKEMGASLIVRRSYAKRNEDIVKRFLMAFLEAIYLYKTDREYSLKVMQKYTRNTDLEMLTTVRHDAIELMEFLPYPRQDDFIGSLARIKNESGEGIQRALGSEDVFEAKYLKDLEQSGITESIRRAHTRGESK